jgi:hypothetical protein
MARKKEKPSGGMGFDAEEKQEALEAEGLKRKDIDKGEVELVDRDTKTPYIETYDKKTGEIEGAIYLKDGSRTGLTAQVKIIEDVKVEQDHDAATQSIEFNGKLDVVNPSKVDRLWDIDITLKNIDSTNLKSDAIKIQELGITDKDNTDSREFKISGEAKNLLLVKEYINTLPDGDSVLNRNDIDSNLINLKDKTSSSRKSSSREDEKTDAAAGESIESFGISINKETPVHFAIALNSLFEKPIKNVKVVKNIPDYFNKPNVRDQSVGVAEVQGSQLMWNIDSLPSNKTVICKFSCDITVSDIEAKKTGTIEVTYEAASSFAGGLGIDKFDAYTSNRFHVDIIERDAEPGVWDCNLVFENTSQFIVELFNADVYSPEEESKKFVDVDPEDVPMLPAGAQWHSKKWVYKSDDYPSFRKKLEFRVVPDFITTVNGTIAISDVELTIASMTGEVQYAIGEEPTEKEIEGKLVQVPTFKEKDVYAVHKLANNGSAPLNEITIEHQYFSDQFKAPDSKEVKLIWDGSEVDLAPAAVSVDRNVLRIELKDLKNSSTGMLKPESNIEVKYPIHCANPEKEAKFETEVLHRGNTYPPSQPIEIRPVVPVIESIHIRRKFRIGKEVVAIGDLGNYKIILTIENIGEMPLTNLVLMDKVPDKFEYGEYSGEQPEITDEVGSDTLKWKIEELKEKERQDFSYEIHGKGEYSPSDAQLAF